LESSPLITVATSTARIAEYSAFFTLRAAAFFIHRLIISPLSPNEENARSTVLKRTLSFYSISDRLDVPLHDADAKHKNEIIAGAVFFSSAAQLKSHGCKERFDADALQRFCVLRHIAKNCLPE